MLHLYGSMKIMKQQQEMLEKKMQTAWMFTQNERAQKPRQKLFSKATAVLSYLRKRKGVT